MASLIISVIALSVGVANLTWQLALYLLNGPRIRVHMTVGALGRGGIVTARLQSVKDLDETFAVPKGASAKPLSDAITETPMPYVLEPHREGTWAMPFEYAADLTRVCRASWPGEVHPIMAYVHRAGGKKICSAQSLPLNLRDAE